MHSNPNQMAVLSANHELMARGVLPYLTEVSTAHVLAFDAKTLRLISANKAARAYHNSEMLALRDMDLWALFPGISKARAFRIATALKRRGRPMTGHHFRTTDANGRSFTVSFVCHQADKSTFVLVMREVTPLVQAHLEARTAERTLATAIEALPDGFVLYNSNDRLVICNETYRQIYQASAPAMVRGARFEDILRYGLSKQQYAVTPGQEDHWLAQRLEAHQGDDIEIEQQLADGRWLRIFERATPDGGRVGLRIDITALKTHQEELARLARTDELTGLLNRRDLDKDVSHLRDTLGPGQRLAALHIDLDRFKFINDVFGHDAGDHVLKTCARILSRARQDASLVARVGGDEFIFVHVTDKTDLGVYQFAQDLVAQLEEPMPFKERICNVGASIGIGFLSHDSKETASDILTAADIALHQAKLDPGISAVIFEPSMREKTKRHTQLVHDMKEGLKRSEFKPYFQPQINARVGKVAGFEALLRWERTSGPPVPAAEFLTLAQNAGLTEALDTIVLQHACKAVREMESWGVKHPRISLNMSMAQLRDSRLVDRFLSVINQYGISPSNLRLELLESTLLDDRTSTIIENVHALIKAGLKVELDDFGTGHAAIATLRRFAVSQIKIDRALVRHIDKDAELQTITAAIIDLARNLGISALAEGVETQAEQDVLLGMHCHTAQGYLHAKPMPLEQIRGFLAERHQV